MTTPGTEKAFDAHGRYVVGQRVKNALPGNELKDGYQIFRGKEVTTQAKDADAFWRKNPLGLKAGVNYTIYQINPDGRREWFDEGRIRPTVGQPPAGALSDQPNTGQQPAATPAAPGAPAAVKSLPAVQAEALYTQTSMQTEILGMLKQELLQRSVENGRLLEENRALRDELINVRQHVAALEAQNQYLQELRAKEQEVTKSIADKLQREFEADVQLEAEKMAKRKMAQSGGQGLSDSIGSLLANPMIQNVMGIMLAKWFGGQDGPPPPQMPGNPPTGPSPIISNDPASAAREYDVNAPSPKIAPVYAVGGQQQ